MKINTKILQNLKQSKLVQDTQETAAIEILKELGFKFDGDRTYEISVGNYNVIALRIKFDKNGKTATFGLYEVNDNIVIQEAEIDVDDIEEMFDGVSKATLIKNLEQFKDSYIFFAEIVIPSSK